MNLGEPMGPRSPSVTDRGRRNRQGGYTLLIVVFAVFLITLGLMVAVPVWQTQIQRENEAELIFRGKQYIEAVRVFQVKNPGRFPRSFDELLEEKCIRRLYSDPMTDQGKWNVILLTQQPGAGRRPGRGGTAREMARQQRARGARAGEVASQEGRGGGQAPSPQQVLIAPQDVLESIPNAQIIGVVSTSDRESIRIYNEQTSYDKWLFFYGQDPEKLPEIVYYGQENTKK
jgi:type II secretory pathway pseudopilin PulG